MSIGRSRVGKSFGAGLTEFRVELSHTAVGDGAIAVDDSAYLDDANRPVLSGEFDYRHLVLCRHEEESQECAGGTILIESSS